MNSSNQNKQKTSYTYLQKCVFFYSLIKWWNSKIHNF